MSWSSTSAVFAYFPDKRNAGTTRRATGQSRVASSATYQCKWPKTTEILGCKASRERNYYADVTIIAMRMLRSDYYTRMRTNDVSIAICLHRIPPRVLHFSVFITTVKMRFEKVRYSRTTPNSRQRLLHTLLSLH